MSDLHMDTSELNVIFVHSDIDDYPLTPNHFRVYAHIARRAGSGQAWPSIANIAKHCRIKEDTAREVIHDLTAYGMLTRTERKGRTPLYRVTKRSVWIPAEQVLQLQAGKKAKGKAKRAAKKAAKEAQVNASGTAETGSNDQPLPNGGRGVEVLTPPESGEGGTPEWGEGCTPELGEGYPSRMGGDEVYPSKFLQEEDPGTAGGEPDPEDTPPPGGRNASSSEKEFASQEGLEASPTQAAYEAPRGATASFEEPTQPIAEDESDIWPEGLEDVPAARENIHEEPQAPEVPEQPAAPQFAPAHDPAAVDARLNQLCNGRWLASPKGTTDPAWIDEASAAGVDRHQIAQVVTLDRVEQFKKDAMAERLDMQVANVNPIPQVCTLVIRKCEAYLAAEQQRRQLAERVPQAQPQQSAPAAAPAARPVTAVQWQVGDVVTYCLDRYEVVEVTGKHLLLDSEECGSALVNLNTSDINKVRLVSRASLDIDEASA